MSKEIIIINDEPFYRIQNGTSYDYAPIPKQFKPYFERLQQKNQQLKLTNQALSGCLKIDKEKIDYYVDRCEQLEKVLDEIRECVNEPWMVADYNIQQQINKQKQYLLQILDKVKGE